MLDLRWPMGLMFSLVGALLAIYGLFPFDCKDANLTLNINVNLWWGLTLLVFGLLMIGLAKLAEKSQGEKK
jgi:hypothetical protein